MVRTMRIARVALGKEPQTMQWAKEMTELLKAKHNAQASVYMDVFADYLTIRWFIESESLATLDQGLQKVFADQEYWQKISKGADLFIEGSVTDRVMVPM